LKQIVFKVSTSAGANVVDDATPDAPPDAPPDAAGVDVETLDVAFFPI
jgi:hypothetical protein